VSSGLAIIVAVNFGQTRTASSLSRTY